MTPDGTVTVVLLPPEREEHLLALAQEWTAAWLIRSAIWVRASDLAPDPVLPDAPPLVFGHVMGRNGSVRVPLFSELSRHEYSLLRFVTVRSVEQETAFSALQDDSIRSLDEHLRLSKPNSTKAQFVNLVFAPTRLSGASAKHVVEAGWNVNILVSPEDRRTANSFDAFTRHSTPEEWTGFILAHTVTAAGLWSTVGSGPYDETEFDGFMEGTHVQRVVVRGVLTGALVVNVGREALRLASQDETPLADPLVAVGEEDLRVMSEDEESRAISDLVRVTLSLSDGQLAYRPVADPPRLEQRRLGFFAQIREVTAFGVDKVKETPAWLLRLGRRRASRRATEELHGSGGDALVDAGGILNWEDADLTDAVAELDRQRENMLERFNEPVTARRHDIDGQLLESVRQASFALIDGSSLPEGHAMRTVWAPEERAPVVRTLTSIVPDWRRTWSPPSDVADDLGSFARLQGTPAHWLDVDFTAAWRDELGKRVSRLGEREGALRQRLGTTQLEIQGCVEALEEASARADDLRDEVTWLRDDLEALEAESATDDVVSDALADPDSVEPFARLGDDTEEDAAAPAGDADEDELDVHVDLDDKVDDEAKMAANLASAVAAESLPQFVVHLASSEDGKLRGELHASEVQLAEAERAEQRALRDLEKAKARRDRTEVALEDLDGQVVRLKGAADGLREWTAGRSRSFSWRLLTALSHEQGRARNDLAQVKEAISTPISVKVEAPSALLDRFMRRCLIAFVISLVTWIAVVAVKYGVPELAQMAPFINPLAWPTWVSGLTALGIFLVLWVSFLVSYYRESSQRRFVLRQVSAHVEYLGEAVRDVRREMQRLDALHAQIPDYLMYLSEVLHRSWTLPEIATLANSATAATQATPESVLFDAVRPASATLPSLMRLAEPPLGAGGEKEAALVRDTVRSLMHRGWRFGALCLLLQSAEEAEALPAGTFDVSRVDRDARIRKAVLKALESSDARSRAGLEQLRRLARHIHLQVMDEVHPAVQELIDDPLEGLDIDDDILAGTDWRTKDWDDFLAEAVGPASAWSTVPFSLDGLAQGVPDVLSSAYGPERLADLANADVSFVPVRDDRVRPIELVVRIDRSPTSLGPVRFRLFDGMGQRGADSEWDSSSTANSTRDADLPVSFSGDWPEDEVASESTSRPTGSESLA